MIIFELVRPGTWLEGLDGAEKRDTAALLDLLETSLVEAAVGLSLFEEAQNRVDEYFDAVMDQSAGWESNSTELREIVQELEAGLPADMDGSARFEAYSRLYDIAGVEVKRRQWRRGEIPQSYVSRQPFLHAKSCLYALDTVEKALKLLKSFPGSPPVVEEAWSSFGRAFPDLIGVRDSAHHAEDRVQGKKRRTRIDVKPLMADWAHSSNGILASNVLADNRFGCTLHDGTYGEVEISARSVGMAYEIVQSAYNAYTWSGRPVRLPS